MMAPSDEPSSHRPLRPVSPIDPGHIQVGAAVTVAAFTRCLEEARILAGPLSHRELESRSGRRLGRTKIGQVLRGTLPQRDFLLVFLEVCGVPKDRWPRWLEAWGRLTRISNGHALPTRYIAPEPATADTRGSETVEAARAQARRIVEDAQNNAEVLLSRARSEAEHSTQSANARIARAEEDRDATRTELHAVNREMDIARERSAERIRVTEDERDRALDRALNLSDTLTDVQERHRAKTAKLERERDAAHAEIGALKAKLEIERRRVRELNESHRAPSGDERYAPAYLVEPNPEETFGTDQVTPPPVIGDWSDGAGGSTRKRQ